MAQRVAEEDLGVCALACDELGKVVQKRVVIEGRVSGGEDEGERAAAAAAAAAWCGESTAGARRTGGDVQRRGGGEVLVPEIVAAGVGVSIGRILALVLKQVDKTAVNVEGEPVAALRAALGLCMVLLHGPDTDPATLKTAKALLHAADGPVEEDAEAGARTASAGEDEAGEGNGEAVVGENGVVDTETAATDGWGGFVAFGSNDDPFGDR